MSAIQNLLEVVDSNQGDTLLQPFDFSTPRQNQMLFFVKPEVFLLPGEGTKAALGLMSERLAHFDVTVAGGYLMSAKTLEERQIMDRHYGYINQVSRTASTSLSDEDKVALRQLCGEGGDTPIRGGHEVLEENPSLSAKALDELWASKRSQKLRSGLYVEAFEVGGTRTVITNGFHPYQLEHFTGSGRKIALILLNSDLPWRFLRSRMLGDTFPEKAAAGSIRGELYRDAAKYGFSDVTIANNCAHMSAGAFEAVFELKNFLSGVEALDFDLSHLRQASHFSSFGLNGSDLDRATNNPVATAGGGRPSSLFDETEECDALSATEMYRQFFSR